MNLFKFSFAVIMLLFCSSCLPKKSVVYLQGQQNPNNASANYEPLIQQDDMLYIHVSSTVTGAATPFNIDSETVGTGGGSFDSQKQSYLVDNAGNIEFPIIGTLNVSGYSLNNLKSILKEKLLPYFSDPVINIRLLNFKVTVLGEVGRPGLITVNSQRITILEAIAAAGDLTPFGKRDNILLIREYQGVKTYNRVDITKAEFVNSPLYYLDQNDVLYIEPRKSKIDSAAIGPNVPAIVSILGFVLTTALILIK
jgi:polysaccharide export outer membrane protein